MIGLFLKRLALDVSSKEITRITTILEQNDIKYELRTTRSRGGIGKALDARAYARSNIAMYKGASQPAFIYRVYVKRKDYTRALKLVF